MLKLTPQGLSVQPLAFCCKLSPELERAELDDDGRAHGKEDTHRHSSCL